jgi:phosphoglycerol transferase MdoB-like AlkP superfamily enzyme
MVFSGLFVISKTMGESAFTSVFDNGYFLRNVGVLSFHAFDTYFNSTSVVKDKDSFPTDEKQQVKSEFTNRKSEGFAKLTGAAKGKNLLVVQVEALQNFVLGLKINGIEVTPNLNKLSAENIYFNNYYSQIAFGNTSDAEFITNNSFYPLSQGAAYFRCVNNSFTSLPKLFKEIGYNAAAMHAYKGSYWNRATIYPRLGFDQFFSQKDFVQDDLLGWGLSDTSFLTQAVAKMKDMPKPFYSFVVTLSSHYPCNGFKKEDIFNTGLGSGNTYRNYINAIHYVDQSIGVLIEQLKAAGLYDNTVIAIYGDHEGLKKNDEPEIDPNVDPVLKSNLGWYNMKNIPLIIMLPGNKQPMKISSVGGQVDFLPTIANLFGIKPTYYMGRDLLNTKESFVTFRDGTVTDGKTVYFKSTDQCIDVTTGEPVDKKAFQKYIDKSMKDLALSDEVVENNLLKEFLTSTDASKLAKLPNGQAAK